jgi:hypothetical protein
LALFVGLRHCRGVRSVVVVVVVVVVGKHLQSRYMLVVWCVWCVATVLPFGAIRMNVSHTKQSA